MAQGTLPQAATHCELLLLGTNNFCLSNVDFMTGTANCSDRIHISPIERRTFSTPIQTNSESTVRYLDEANLTNLSFCGFRALLSIVGLWSLLSVGPSTNADEPHVVQATATDLSGGALKVPGGLPVGGELVSLSKPGQSVTFSDLPAGSSLAIRYGSVSVGTISVAINDKEPHKLNVHSSGDLTKSFLNAKLNLSIPQGAGL